MGKGLSKTDCPLLIHVIVICLSTTSRPHAEKRAEIDSLLLSDGFVPSADDIEDLLSLSRYANRYANARGNNITNSILSEMKVEHYELFYIAGSFAVQNFTETYVDNSTFCYEGSVQNFPPNYPPNENFLISSRNKSKLILPQDSFSKIPYWIDIPIPSQEKFNSAITSGITLTITMRTNYSVHSRDIFSISPWDMSNITEYSYESTPYKSTPTNSKVHLVDSDSLTSDPSTNPTTPTKLSN